MSSELGWRVDWQILDLDTEKPTSVRAGRPRHAPPCGASPVRAKSDYPIEGRANVTTEELEALLQGSQESDTLEFKRAMGWDLGLVKDILAMANVQDGGRIVIGIEDETLVRQGVSQEQLDSFTPDIMMDRVAVFADPHVSFSVDKVPDTAGLWFVVITIAAFERTPVICAKDGGVQNELQRGAVYYRSKTGRPKSARVANANDMRDIVERAAIQTMRHFQSLGLQARTMEAAAPSDQPALATQMAEKFDEELGGL